MGEHRSWGVPELYLPEVAGWLAVAVLGLVVGSYGAQVFQDPPPPPLSVQASPAPERVVWLLPPAADAQPAHRSPAPSLDPPELGQPTATRVPTPTPSPGGHAALPLIATDTVVARVLLTEVRFEAHHPEPTPARAAAPGQPRPTRGDELVDTRLSAVSTLSPDPDLDGWRSTRAALAEGHLPDPAAVRIEDLVNAQASSVPLPPRGEPLSVDLELAPHPWREGRHLLRVGLRSADRSGPSSGGDSASLPLQLTVLVDTSGSMGLDSRLAQVKAGLHALVDRLGPDDRLTLVSFSDDAEVQLTDGQAASSAHLRMVIDGLSADGASATAAALQHAGQEALRHFHPGADNRLVLITDGEANVGVDELDAVGRGVEALAARGIALDVVAVGSGDASTAPVGELAARGRGRYLAADGFKDARRILAHELLGETAAAPTHHQVTVAFAAEAVSGWRLLGHDGSTPSGALPPLTLEPGQTITALYELALTPAFLAAELDRGLGEIRLASFADQAGTVARQVISVPRRLLRSNFAAASRDLRVSLAAAAFGSLLRRPPPQPEPWQQVAGLVDERRSEDRMLRRLVLQAGRLALRQGSPAQQTGQGAPIASPDVDPTLLLRRVQRAQESLAPCLSQGGTEGRLDLALELRQGAVIDVQAALPGADPALLDCVDRTARGWRFPTGWTARLDLPLSVEHRDFRQAGG